MVIKSGKCLAEEVKNTPVPYGSFAFWWLGQLGYVFKLGEAVVYVDPYLAPYVARQVDPVLSPEDMAGASLLLGTHDHSDHIDNSVWGTLAKLDSDVVFVAPAPVTKDVCERLEIAPERVIAAEENKTIDSCGIKIIPVAAAHEILEYVDGRSAFLSYIIEGNGCRILHCGDSCIYEGYITKLKAFGKFDAIFVPINGRDAVRLRRNCIGNMTYQEAVDLAGTLAPTLTVPGHYEMFVNNSCDVELFRDYLDAKFPELKCWIGDHGQLVIFSAEDA